MAYVSIRQCLSILVVLPSLIFVADGNLSCDSFYTKDNPFGIASCVTGYFSPDISVTSILTENSFTTKPQKNFIALCINGYEAVSLQSVYHIWSSVQVIFESNLTGAEYHEADSCIDLQPANHTWTSVIQYFVLGGNALDKTIFYLSPFKITCLGIRAKKPQDVYRFSAVFKGIDWRFPAAFLLGLIIFYNADRLSRNSVFFYSSGVTLGVLLSLLLFVYVLHKFIPRRGGAYAILVGGWSIVAFVIQWTVGNFKELLLNNNRWVIGYILVAGVISFSVCYYYGPVTSNRGLDLIRWALQIAGLILLYMGTRSEEMSLAVVVIALLSHFIGSRGFLPAVIRMLPRQWVSYRIYYIFFPPKHKFLSEEEYVVQGVEETSKALEELRQYCSSPECNAWRVISRLKDPCRFAAFVSGGQHILDEEMSDYENDPAPVTESEIEDNLKDSSEEECL